MNLAKLMNCRAVNVRPLSQFPGISQSEKVVVAESDNNFASEIDDFDRQILFELDKNCRQSTAQLTEKLGRSRQTIEYRIKRLQDLKVLTGFNAIFNASKMGFYPYKFKLKLRNVPEDRQRLLDHLYSIGRVYWIGQSSGSWDMLFGVFYKSKLELVEIVNGLNLNFPRSIVDIHGNEIIEIIQFPKMYLTRQIVEPKHHTSADTVESKLDDVDYLILAELIQNARIPVNHLAKNVGASPAITRRKMQLLEERGIIVQDRIGVDHKKLGYDFYKAVFKLNGFTEAEHQRFYEHICRIPELQFYLRNLWSVELELMAGSFEYYQSIIDDIKRAFPRMLGEYDTLLLSTDEWTTAFTNYLRISSEDCRLAAAS